MRETEPDTRQPKPTSLGSREREMRTVLDEELIG